MHVLRDTSPTINLSLQMCDTTTTEHGKKQSASYCERLHAVSTYLTYNIANESIHLRGKGRHSSQLREARGNLHLLGAGMASVWRDRSELDRPLFATSLPDKLSVHRGLERGKGRCPSEVFSSPPRVICHSHAASDRDPLAPAYKADTVIAQQVLTGDWGAALWLSSIP